MLSKEMISKIEEFVYKHPRSIQELATHVGKNWRTVDRYVEEIQKEYGTIATRVFRGGTRGALKIVYWASIEKASSTIFQSQLEEQILKGRTKFDFSPFDIFQHVSDKHKDARVESAVDEKTMTLDNLAKHLLQTKKQLLIMSGNLSFINFSDKKTDIFDVFEKLVEKGVSIKVLCRVDISGKENIQQMLSLNFKHGRNCVEIRHREQPLRATIIDNGLFRMKEIKEPTGRRKELAEKTFIFYTIHDKEWAEWLSRIFWKMFSSSVDANKRLTEISKLH
jgi:hypothetical protein